MTRLPVSQLQLGSGRTCHTIYHLHKADGTERTASGGLDPACEPQHAKPQNFGTILHKLWVTIPFASVVCMPR
jgi:hypothetical protein